MKEKLIELLEDAPMDYEGNRNVGVIADHLIANGVTVQKWIPVSDPPELFTGVNAYCPTTDNIYTLYLNARGEWRFFDKIVEGALVDEPVTHWQPLPEPPKEDI